MKKIVIILPYFGKFPNYFHLFLNSCYHNSDFDFLIVTDDKLSTKGNVKVLRMQWSELVNYIQSKFDFKISIQSPYKLCDFKPAYGYIFEKYLEGYDYWGHCDADIIWGNLSLLSSVLNKCYDRIGNYGHLMLYKNDFEVNRWFMTLKSVRVPNYRDVFSNDRNFSFDEFAGMNILLAENKKTVFDERHFDDIIFYASNLFSRRDCQGVKIKHNTPQYFHYDYGKLYRTVWIDNKWLVDESLYIHLQKRNMTININDKDNYYIIPNQFVSPNIFSQELDGLSKDRFDLRYHLFMLKTTLKEKFRILSQ